MKNLVAFGKFATIYIIMSIFMLMIHVQTDSDAEIQSLWNRHLNCVTVCGGGFKEAFEGTQLCHYRNDALEKRIRMETKCMLDCNGHEAAEDQAQCMCDYCKRDLLYKTFCKEPGIRTHIKKDECETEVCTGNAKYHYFFCSARDEKDFAKRKATFEENE